MPKSILLDIEGTTTPIAFVYDVLFPYAREHLNDWHQQRPTPWADIEKLAEEYGKDDDPDKPLLERGSNAIDEYLRFLMDKDRKSTALKSIQGKIWKQGFENGGLKGEFFEDVPRALEQWNADGKKVYIFSSGSVTAQQLIFRHSTFGDLTKYLSGYFDTETGPKREPQSYRKIAEKIGEPPSNVLFLSDVCEELNAAQQAGMQTALVIRPGNKPATYSGKTATSFDQV